MYTYSTGQPTGIILAKSPDIHNIIYHTLATVQITFKVYKNLWIILKGLEKENKTHQFPVYSFKEWMTLNICKAGLWMTSKPFHWILKQKGKCRNSQTNSNM